MKYNQCLQDVATPIVHDLFALVVRHVGPRITQSSDPYVACTERQAAMVAELEHILNLHARRNGVHECLRAALPKALLLNATMASMWVPALSEAEFPGVPGDVGNGVGGFCERKIWAGQELPHHVADGDLVPMLLRVLRGTPHSNITASAMKDIDLELEWDMRFPHRSAGAVEKLMEDAC